MARDGRVGALAGLFVSKCRRRAATLVFILDLKALCHALPTRTINVVQKLITTLACACAIILAKGKIHATYVRNAN